MVMEANLSPSPQCVGREFVRQYYTLLNKSPLHLHRFYSNDSSFVHGGLTPKDREAVAVYGQQEIHQKIVDLDFRECKAKILLVDSHRTLQDGVVIQVTGELSNNGQPMRRFMQTFVLAPQSAKKYYVRNDIFRYQDEIFSDDEGEAEGMHSDVDEGHHQQADIHQYEAAPMNPPPGLNGSALPEEMEIHEAPVQPPTQPTFPAPVPVLSPTSPRTVSPVPATVQIPTVVAIPTPVASPALSAQSPVSVSQPEQPATVEEPVKIEPVLSPKNQWEESPIESGNASQEPKTFANLFKSAGQYPPPRPANYQAPTQPISQPGQYPSDHDYSAAQGTTTGGGQRGGQRGGRGGMMVRGGGMGNYRDRSEKTDRMDRGERAHSRDSADDGNGNEWRQANGDRDRDRPDNRGGDNRRFNNLDDEQQLFVGNIPLNATETEIKEEFEKFGKVLEMRILSKSNRVGPGNRPAPNFGFIVFEDAAVAQSVLEKKQIFLHGDHRLNVEKKQHPRSARTGGGGPGNMGGGAPMGDRMPPGPRNEMRGGMGRGGSMGPGRGGRGGMPFNRDGRGGPAMPRGGGAGAGANQYGRRQ